MKTAIVTGANKGIGFEVVRQLAEQGYRVYLGARDPQRGKASAAQLTSQGLDVRWLPLDVTSEASVEEAYKSFSKESDSLDVLVNNAGVYLPGDGHPSELSLETFLKTFEVNVFGVLRVSQKFLPLLTKGLHPSLVMVSSGLGSLGLQSDASSGLSQWAATAYSASKTALNAITVAFANELKDSGIKVNAVSPGFIDTDLNGHTGVHPTSFAAEVLLRYAIANEKTPHGSFQNEWGNELPW